MTHRKQKHHEYATTQVQIPVMWHNDRESVIITLTLQNIRQRKIVSCIGSPQPTYSHREWSRNPRGHGEEDPSFYKGRRSAVVANPFIMLRVMVHTFSLKILNEYVRQISFEKNVTHVILYQSREETGYSYDSPSKDCVQWKDR